MTGNKRKRGKKSFTPKSLNREAIPVDVKREIRQRCGFGCVFCGLPFYDYEHMAEWAIVKRHVASEMTLLCPNHHRQKTNGLISKADLEEANRSPYNIVKDMDPFPFRVQSASLVLQLGGISFFYDQGAAAAGTVVLSIKSERIIWLNFQEGNLLLNLSLYDQKGKQIVSIRDNELVYSTDPWDITLVGKTVRIQVQARDTLLSLTFDPNANVISFNEAKLRFSGYEVLIDKDGFNMPASNNGFKNCRIKGSGHLFNYGGEPSTAAINFPGAKAY